VLADPATGNEIGSVPELGAKETNDAIAKAHAAFGPWSKTTAKERADLLGKLFQLMNENNEE
jgi:succinate-semialdehyde dehydrogenase/glutarate-semialdehyde dehydrogenase